MPSWEVMRDTFKDDPERETKLKASASFWWLAEARPRLKTQASLRRLDVAFSALQSQVEACWPPKRQP